jgi:hypothetical protein
VSALQAQSPKFKLQQFPPHPPKKKKEKRKRKRKKELYQEVITELGLPGLCRTQLGEGLKLPKGKKLSVISLRALLSSGITEAQVAHCGQNDFYF